MRVAKKLDAWQGAGLLTDRQAADIARWEADKSRGTPFLVWGVAAVGALAITAGIVSLVAANWQDVPASVKLAGVFALLFGSLGGAATAARLGSTWPRDLCLLLHGGLVVAAIGLMAQTYHLHAHPWRALALCALLALPAAVIATRGLLTYWFLVNLTLGGYLFLRDAHVFEHGDHAMRLLAPGYALVLVLFGRPALRLPPATATALRRWGYAILAGEALGASYAWSSHRVVHASVPFAAAASVFVVAVLAHAALDLAPRDERLGKGRGMRLLTLGLFTFLVAGATAFALFGGDSSSALLRQLFGFALFCALCLTVAVSGASTGDKRLTSLATAALALRILVLFVELARDLFTTGLGLIATGVVFLALAFGWWHLRRLVLARGAA